MKDRKKTPFELNEVFQLLIDSMPDIVVVKDTDGRHLVVNKATEKFTGLTKADLLGKTMEDIAPADFARQCRISDEAAMAAANPTRALEYSTGRDGRITVLDSIKSPIRDGNNAVLGLVAVSRDVTELKQVEESLRKSENFIRCILETVDEGFIVVDREYRIRSANKAYLSQVGKGLDEVIGRPCYEVSHHTDRPCYEAGETCAVRNSFLTGEPDSQMHVHFENKDRKMYVETKSYPIKDEAGNTHSVIEVINNVTEKVKLEEQLRHSQKLDALGQLAGGIAHDFNNILTAIIGYGYMIKMKAGEGDPLRHSIGHILDAAERASNLTRGLLAFSRKEPLSKKPVAMIEVLTHIEKLLRNIIGENIEMRLSVSKEEMVVVADRGQIEQVLINLATNARDAMPNGGYLTFTAEPVVIDREFVKAHGYGRPGAYALLSVTDTGAGMDEQTKEKVFEPFFTTKEVGKGTGLGLSIVYGIVKQHNGYVNCYSEPGQGTTFKVYLPLVKDPVSTARSADPSPLSGGTETILVAEDNAGVRALMKELLGQGGYTVIEAKDGEEAVTLFRERGETIDLLVLDVVMPRKDGQKVFEEIQQLRPGVKAILMSGYAADVIKMNTLQKEKLTFLSKPVVPLELLRLVRETLDRQGDGRP